MTKLKDVIKCLDTEIRIGIGQFPCSKELDKCIKTLKELDSELTAQNDMKCREIDINLK